jgi:hypothetical protein
VRDAGEWRICSGDGHVDDRLYFNKGKAEGVTFVPASRESAFDVSRCKVNVKTEFGGEANWNIHTSGASHRQNKPMAGYFLFSKPLQGIDMRLLYRLSSAISSFSSSTE